MIGRVLRAGPMALAAGLLGLACALHLLTLLRAPAAYSPARIDITLRAGQSLTLGRQELAAPQAEAGHLALRRDAAGTWWIRSLTGRPLALQRGAVERRTGSIGVAAGTRFQLGASSFHVEAARPGEVSFSDGAHRWDFDGATLERDGVAQPPCPDARFGARAVAAWNRWAPHALTLARPLAFGGNLYCGDRLGIAAIGPASASMARGPDGTLLLASAPGAAPLLVASLEGAVDLAQREEALDGASAVTAGRTRFLVALDGDTLRLRPVSHVALYPGRQATLPPQLAWQWEQRRLWWPPAAPAWFCALAFAAAAGVAGVLALTRGARLADVVRAAAGLLLAAAGLAALVLQRAGTPPAIGLSVLLAWAALWYALLAPRTLRLATVAGVLLLALGLLAQLELGLGATDTSWLRHAQKTAALLALGLGAGGCLAIRRRATPLSQHSVEWLLLLLAGGALAGLALQAAFGDETGVFDLQPVEFAKLALTALTAHCIALGIGAREGAGTLLRWLRLGAPVLLFVALLAVALVQVDDYSPLILLLVWSGAMALAWALADRKYTAAAALAAVACGAAFTIAALRGAGPGEVAQWSFYADRFLVWLDPATHPHTGQQLLQGARAVADGGLWGADRLFGLSTLGQGAGAVLRIPAVQDDFAPSFFLNRHGLAGGIALWLLQALFVAALLQSAARAWAASVRARDFRHAWLARLRCFALCGGAAFVLGHFVLSWGTNLAIFPVMGQPMSFLSAGGSHLLFFICPLLALAATSAQSLEESHHAGLRST